MRRLTLEQGDRSGGRVLACAAVLATFLALLTFASRAQAAPSTHKLIWGPYDEQSFDTYADLGVGLYEFTVNWSRIAPTKPHNPTDPDDPAYIWTPAVDEILERAGKRGIEVVIAVAGAPRWANGGKSWRWAPTNPQDYADFMTAAAKRWSQVHHWQVWGEPTRRANFMPLAAHTEGIELTKAQRLGPELYARILDAAYVALKAVSPTNLVIGGNSFSGGDVRPLAFIKALRLPDGKPPRMDFYGQNPFGYRRPDLKQDQVNTESGVADFSDLDVVAEYVDRYLSRAGHNPGKLKLFLSEYFVPTDHANFEFNYWVSRQTAKIWLVDAFKIVNSWRRIYTLGWFALYDEAPNGKGTEVNRGLLTWEGHRKPAYYAFKNG